MPRLNSANMSKPNILRWDFTEDERRVGILGKIVIDTGDADADRALKRFDEKDWRLLAQEALATVIARDRDIWKQSYYHEKEMPGSTIPPSNASGTPTYNLNPTPRQDAASHVKEEWEA